MTQSNSGFILIVGFLGMVLGHNDNIELSAVNICLGGTAAGLTAMMVKLLKPQLKYYFEFHNPLASARAKNISYNH